MSLLKPTDAAGRNAVKTTNTTVKEKIMMEELTYIQLATVFSQHWRKIKDNAALKCIKMISHTQIRHSDPN